MNELRRAIVRSAVQKGLGEIRQDPKRGIRKLVDLGSHFSRGRFQKRIFAVMQNELVNPSSAYYALATRLISSVKQENLEQFGMNVGYNSWTHGAAVIRQYEAAHGYNVPWCLVLDLTRGLGFDLDDLMRQGEKLGIYSYMIFAGDCQRTSALFPIFAKHGDSAVFLLLPDAQLPQVNLENVRNVMALLPCSDERTPESAQELHARMCLYGLWARYDGERAPHVLDGSLERLAVALGAPAVFVVPGPEADGETLEAVREYARRSREKKTEAAFLVDFFSAIEEIDRVISVEACMLGIASDGTIFTAQGPNDKIDINHISLEDVLLCAMPRVTYQTDDRDRI
jgi:hypothetical protein